MKLVNADMMPDRDEEAALWCLELTGDLSPAQRRAFDDWHADPANAEAYERALGAWDLADAIAGEPEVIGMRTDALEAYRRGNQRRWQRPGIWHRAGWASLASVAAALLLLIAWSALPNHDAYRTAIGERRVATLSDGSRLSLDANSEVEARFDAKRRTLTLSRGRAKFDVAHNPLRPFTVAAGDKLVVATGTSFSVEMLGGEVRVVLYEGHVAVLDRGGVPVRTNGGEAADVQLTPGRELTVAAMSDSLASVGTAGADAASGWQRGQLNFEDEPLPLAVERMNRSLSEPLVVGDDSAARVRVTGVFDDRNAAGFLDALGQISGIRAQRRDGKVILTKG